MNDLTNLLKLSVEREAQKQALKTYNDLARQLLELLKPPPAAKPVEAMAIQVEREIWECALAAGEKALQPIVVADAIPMLTCPACKDPTPGLIDGLCLECDELFNLSMQRGLEARESSNGVLQMKRRVQ